MHTEEALSLFAAATAAGIAAKTTVAQAWLAATAAAEAAAVAQQ